MRVSDLIVEQNYMVKVKDKFIELTYAGFTHDGTHYFRRGIHYPELLTVGINDIEHRITNLNDWPDERIRKPINQYQ